MRDLLSPAPGAPGIAARWTSSAKSGVGTALTARSQVWFTLSHGILNEIYYPRIDHACMSMTGFNPDAVTKILTGYGLKPMPNASREPLVTYISLRMPNRGGAEGGTPELYFTDPDGLAIQIQDVKYCGGGGLLGELCPPLPPL